MLLFLAGSYGGQIQNVVLTPMSRDGASLTLARRLCFISLFLFFIRLLQVPAKSITVIKNNCKNTYDAAHETIVHLALEISWHPKRRCICIDSLEPTPPVCTKLWEGPRYRYNFVQLHMHKD